VLIRYSVRVVRKKHVFCNAIIAHVDHGKTTLVDKLLQQSGTLSSRGDAQERVMDSNDIEKERGITILAKNTAINWQDYRINIVDTPGHADFGGEVERVDKPGARPDWVMDQVFDLFDNLGATDDQLDFQVVYASALNGWASNDADVQSDDMTPLFETIVSQVAPPDADSEGAFQMQISQLDYNSYVGVIGVGRIKRGKVRVNQQVTVAMADGKTRNGKISKVLGYLGLDRDDVEEGSAGDIVAITGLGELLQNELVHNVALRVEETDNPDKFRVSGRGELHLGILIENMRREGYELAVSRPEVILKEEDGQTMEPFETLTIDCEEQHQGAIMEQLGLRKAELTNMSPDGLGRIRMDFIIPSRGLIGFQTEFMTMTSGSGLLYHTFDHYGPHKGGSIGQRKNGVLIANATGKALTNALFNLQERGRLFIGHGVEVYEGMIIGIHSRENDLSIEKA